jgi:D-3-phosphoglycerate dehydrogenase
MSDIVVTERIVGDALTALARTHDIAFEPDLWRSPERLREAVATVRSLIVRNQTQVTPELLAAAPRLEIVARAGVGLDNVDVAAASAAGVVVSYTPQANAVSVAELAMGLMLALARKIPAADRDVRAGGWDRLRFTGTELAGKTLGLVGFGRIGRMTAERARAFGMKLLAYDPAVEADSPAARDLGARLVRLDDLLEEADVVSCHAPLTADTARLFDASRFGRMKPGATFINTSRGEIVDEAALLAALQSGRLGGAALDVRQTEPPGPTPFDALENVVLMPHVGAFTAEAQRRTIEAVCRDVTAVLAGGEAAEYANFPRPRRAARAV